MAISQEEEAFLNSRGINLDDQFDDNQLKEIGSLINQYRSTQDNKGLLNTAGSLLTGIDAYTFGVGNKVGELGNAAIDWATGQDSFGNAYDKYYKANKLAKETFSEDHPFLSLGISLASPSVLGKVGAVKKGKELLSGGEKFKDALKTNIALNTATGGVQGAMNEESLEDMAMGGGIGAAAGGLVGGLTTPFASAIDYLIGKPSTLKMDAYRKAMGMTKEAVDNEGKQAEQVQELYNMGFRPGLKSKGAVKETLDEAAKAPRNDISNILGSADIALEGVNAQRAEDLTEAFNDNVNSLKQYGQKRQGIAQGQLEAAEAKNLDKFNAESDNALKLYHDRFGLYKPNGGIDPEIDSYLQSLDPDQFQELYQKFKNGDRMNVKDIQAMKAYDAQFDPYNEAVGKAKKGLESANSKAKDAFSSKSSAIDDNVGYKIGELEGNLERDLNNPIRPKLDEGRFIDDVSRTFDSGKRDQADAVAQDYLHKLRENGDRSKSFTGLNDEKTTLGKRINWGGSDLTQIDKDTSTSAYHMIKQALEDGVQKYLGDDALIKYQGAKKTLGTLTESSKNLGDQIDKAKGYNPFTSLIHNLLTDNKYVNNAAYYGLEAADKAIKKTFGTNKTDFTTKLPLLTNILKEKFDTDYSDKRIEGQKADDRTSLNFSEGDNDMPVKNTGYKALDSIEDEDLKKLAHAVIKQESAWNPKAVSKAGAEGLMQIMPAMQKAYGVKNEFDPEENIRGGVSILQDELKAFKGDRMLALAAYNAGRPAVMRAIRKGGSRDFEVIKEHLPQETQDYVLKVLKNYDSIEV